MALIEWKDSFSVGVSELDNDHRYLLDLINQLHDAKERKQGTAVVAEILVKLRDHVANHAVREEALMERIGYPETTAHKHSHANAVASIERLISINQNSHSDDTVRQVLDFMKAWFATHVICTDMKLREHFVEKGVADVKVGSGDHWEVGVFQRWGRKTDVVGIRGRIFILALIPFFAFVAVVGWLVMDRVHTTVVLDQMEQITVLGADIGGLVHELQKERGMSSVYVESKGAKFAS